LRLLLDEMYPSVVAERLRSRGHDVVAVTERPELRSLADADVFTVSLSERRTVVTENVADFSGIADSLELAVTPRPHPPSGPQVGPCAMWWKGTGTRTVARTACHGGKHGYHAGQESGTGSRRGRRPLS
jgi:hypothetical protein